jgi:hypothetical protein
MDLCQLALARQQTGLPVVAEVMVQAGPHTRPDVIKIARAIIAGLDRHYHHQEITWTLLGKSYKIGA